jgi:hypothetical protein
MPSAGISGGGYAWLRAVRVFCTNKPSAPANYVKHLHYSCQGKKPVHHQQSHYFGIPMKQHKFSFLRKPKLPNNGVDHVPENL